MKKIAVVLLLISFLAIPISAQAEMETNSLSGYVHISGKTLVVGNHPDPKISIPVATWIIDETSLFILNRTIVTPSKLDKIRVEAVISYENSDDAIVEFNATTLKELNHLPVSYSTSQLPHS